MTEQRRALPRLDSAREQTGRKKCRRLTSTRTANLNSWKEFLLFADAAKLRLGADAEVDAGVVR